MTVWTVVIILIVLVRLLGIVLAADAVMTGRTPQGTLAWVFSLLMLPEVAVWFYFIFGSRRFTGYVKFRKRRRAMLNPVAHAVLETFRSFVSLPRDPPDSFDTIGRMLALPPTVGNRVDLLIDGEATYAAIYEAIESAKQYLLIEFYILRGDVQGARLRNALAKAAARGVRVYVIDGVGATWTTPKRVRREYEAAGIRFVAFQSRRTLQGLLGAISLWRWQLNFRNHRKIVIADGRVAFLGGLNIGEEYLGRATDPLLRPWRDTHARVTGPAVLPVQVAWLEDWHAATGELPALNWISEAASDTSGDEGRVLIAPTGPADELESCGLLVHELIGRAKRRVWIATPYFVPDEAIIHAIQLAALRGADVRIMIPDAFDTRLPWLSAFTYYDSVMRAGGQIYRYKPGFMHQKVMLCDGLACVTSANLDNRSFRINFEIGLLADGCAFVDSVQQMLERDFECCRKVGREDFQKRSWWFRLLCRCARLLAPIQ